MAKHRPARRSWPLMLGGSLGVMLGLQVFRVWLPSILLVLEDYLSHEMMGLLALATFLLALLAPALGRRGGARRLLLISAGILALLRLALQVSGNAVAGLVIAGLAVACWLAWLAGLAAWLREQRQGGAFVPILTLGFSLDTALRGALFTLDLPVRTGALPLAGSVLLVLAFLALLRPAAAAPPGTGRAAGGAPLWALLGLGPWFFLQIVVFQNPGRLQVLSGLDFGAVLLLIHAANALSLALVLFIAGRDRPAPLPQRLLTIALSLAVAALLQWLPDLRGSAALLLLPANALLGGAAALAGVAALGHPGRGAGPGPAAVHRWWAGTMVLFLVFVFFFYARYAAFGLFPAAAAFTALFALAAPLGSRAVRDSKKTQPAGSAEALWPSARRAPFVVFALATVLTLWPLLHPAPSPHPVIADRPESLQVMTYNMHWGFDVRGSAGLEATARAIAASGADVVGLQEVTRGWSVHGMVDSLTWLSHRLNMPYVYGPMVGTNWGTAILSRFPIVESGHAALPQPLSPVPRGYTWATIAAGGRPVTVITPHLDHEPDHQMARQQQIQALLDFWGGRERSVILGDFNASPATAEIAMVTGAGLVDAWEAAGEGMGYTFRSDSPYERIDYIFVSPDLAVTEARALGGTASDHLAVLARIALEPE